MLYATGLLLLLLGSILVSGSTNKNDIAFPGGSSLNNSKGHLRQVVANATYQVQFLYIVPKDAIIRQSYQLSIGKYIAGNLRQFYRYHIGKTIEYTSPNVIMYRSPYTIAEIINGTNGAISSPPDLTPDGFKQNIYRHLVEVINANYHREFYEEMRIFIGVTEINTFAAVGGGGVVSVTAQEIQLNDASPDISFPFDHELGHALGLHHTAETVECLRQFGIMEPPNEYTFMNPVANYEYSFPQPMVDYQKKLLLGQLDPSCLLTLGGRPHPSLYLKNICENKADIIKNGRVDVSDLAQIIVRWGSCDPSPNAPHPGWKYFDCPSDLNCDGLVNIEDLSILITNYGSFSR